MFFLFSGHASSDSHIIFSLTGDSEIAVPDCFQQRTKENPRLLRDFLSINDCI